MRQRLADAGQVSEELLQERIQAAICENWWYRVEGLAEAARTVEELGRPDYAAYPLNEIPGQAPHGVVLLGALEDSLILELDSSQTSRAFRATAGEIHELLIAARAENVWEFMEPAGEKHSPPSDARPEPAETNSTDVISLTGPLFDASRESVAFYRRLRPDGRELTESERRATREQLVTDAAWLRRLARAEAILPETLTPGQPAIDLDRLTQGWRCIQRSLVLALAESPELRERAYPADAPMTTEDYS